MVSSALLVSLTLLFRAQWDTTGEPLQTWDWNWVGMRPWAPPAELRQWLVRWSPALVGFGLLVFVLAVAFLH
jgi:hypothetical protein